MFSSHVFDHGSVCVKSGLLIRPRMSPHPGELQSVTSMPRPPATNFSAGASVESSESPAKTIDFGGGHDGATVVVVEAAVDATVDGAVDGSAARLLLVLSPSTTAATPAPMATAASPETMIHITRFEGRNPMDASQNTPPQGAEARGSRATRRRGPRTRDARHGQ